MNKCLLASLISVLPVGAFAADLPHRAPAPAPAFTSAPTWAGSYLGVDVGGGWTKNSGSWIGNAAPAVIGSLIGTAPQNASGIVGGLYGGHNWQSNNIVFGIEADIEASSLSKTSNVTSLDVALAPLGPIAAVSERSRLPWQGSLRGRIGYSFGSALLYATGGLAVASVETRVTNTGRPSPDSFRKTVSGWTLGAGVEYAIDTKWSARAEYRYSDFARFNNSLNASVFIPNSVIVNQHVTESVVRVGLTYKFGGPSAVVAKY